MARFEVKSKVASFTGVVAGAAFAAGKATLDSEKAADAKALRYFQRRNGYEVTPLDVDETPQEAPADPGPARPASDAKKAEWKAYAISQGMPEEEAEKATRDQLAQRFDKEGAN